MIFTFNEEARIERAVRNFVQSGRVLVVDNHSTDRTTEIAVAAGAQVLMHKNPGWVEDADTVEKVKAAVDTPWLYWAYADEMIDGPTLSKIVETVEQDKVSIVRIMRKNYYYGVFCHEAYANQLNRVFKKDAIDFTGNEIHHFGTPTVSESAIKYLDPERYFVHHFISNNAKSYLRTIDGYTDIEAGRASPKSPGRFFLHVLRSFAGNYVVRKGYKAGLPGLFLGLQMIYYEALLNMKCYETHEGLTGRRIEDSNNLVRDRLLKSVH